MELSVEGMLRASCVERVESVLKAMPGIARAVVNVTCVDF